MAVKEERDTAGSPANEAQPGALQGLWGRLDQIGQRHARLIVAMCAGLIIVTVLVFANTAYRRSLAERIGREVSEATAPDLPLAKSIEKLKDMKARYPDSEHLALILATLGNQLYRNGELVAAKEEYETFLTKFEGHPLSLPVTTLLPGLKENIDFDTRQKADLLKIPSLDNHPLRRARLQTEIAGLREKYEELKGKPDRKEEAEALKALIDLRLAGPLNLGPLKLPHPVLVFHLKGKEKETLDIHVELFEDEAPEATASIVQLAQKGYFNGLRFAKTEGDSRLRIEAKKEGAVDYALPFESTSREGDSGSLVLVRQGANNAAAEFEFLLKSGTLSADTTVAGVIPSYVGIEIARKVTPDHVVDSVTVQSKRAHEYQPRTVKP